MIRSRFAYLSFAIAVCPPLLLGQQPVAKQPSDLQVLLRSATGSNRFQIGEVISFGSRLLQQHSQSLPGALCTVLGVELRISTVPIL